MNKLTERQNSTQNPKAVKAYQQLNALVSALESKELPDETVGLIDQVIDQLNAMSETEEYFVKTIKQKEKELLKLVEKKHRIVPQNYYRNLWMVVGMSAFGLPAGLAFGLSMGNMGLMGIGLPIGMAVGIGVGLSMDKKAFDEGRQLDFEVKP